MAELIALLIVAVGSLLGSSADYNTLAKEVAAKVRDNPPVPITDVAVAITPAEEIELVDGEEPYPAGSVRIAFAFEGLYLEPLSIRDALITVDGVRLGDNGKLTITSISFDTEIDEGDLTSALRAETDALGSSAQVLIDKAGVTLKGSYKALLARVPFAVTGNLGIESQTQLVFTIDKSNMVGIPVPGPVNRLIENEVNPVYDLAKFHERSKEDIERAKEQLNYTFYLEIQEIVPDAGYITVTGIS